MLESRKPDKYWVEGLLVYFADLFLTKIRILAEPGLKLVNGLSVGVVDLRAVFPFEP